MLSPLLSPDRLLGLSPALRARPELRPLLYAVLSRQGRLDALEASEHQRARTEYLATVAQTTLLRSRAISVLDAAARRGIRLLLLKGILFDELLYGLPGARPMSDVDLAVEPRDLAQMVALLEELGYRRLYPGRRRFSEELTHGHDVAMVGHGVNIELHHRIHHELGMDPAIGPMFERAIEVDVLDGRRWAPGWDDHLFYVAAHAATHALGETPMWLFDVALLLERTGSLVGAEKEATRRRARAGVWSALSLAHEIFPDVVPAPSLPPGHWFRQQVIRGVLGSAPLAAAPAQWSSLLVRAALTDSPLVAARSLVRKVGLRLYEVVEARTG